MSAMTVFPPAKAQWFPFGAAAPGEIVQRLRAEGYVVTGPLVRKDTVYLADIKVGPRGRERLVIDAWSGEILQRFAARRGRGGPDFVPEGGEFNEPPPLGPPPARAFREETDLGPEEVAPRAKEEAPPKARAKSKPAAIARRPPDARPPSQTGPPSTSAAPAGISAPASAPTAAPNGAAKAETPPPNLSGKEAQPKPEAASPPAAAQTQAKEAAPTSNPAPAESAEKGQKKLNDVPVNPLE